MADDVLIRVDGVGKKFCRSLRKSLWYGLNDIVSDLNPFAQTNAELGPPSRGAALREEEFWAVDGVSFELRRGECLGLIGRNGAGKTTLLKMLNGLIKPDKGRIEMHGRVGGLIALGAGFNPILSGRENIYVNGSVLGLARRDIAERIDEIVDFADLREFIDTPVQSYSSGMQIRLGFAVATALRPDILLLDEVLAVGDVAFQNKCYARLGDLQKDSAVIFVSHSMMKVARICTHAMLIARGTSEGITSTDAAVARYEQSNDAVELEAQSFRNLERPVEEAEFSLSTSAIGFGEPICGRVTLRTTEELCAPLLRMAFIATDGTVAGEWNTRVSSQQLCIPSGRSSIDIALPRLFLRPGRYYVTLAVQEGDSMRQPVMFHNYRNLEVHGAFTGACHHLIEGTSVVTQG